MKHQPTMAPRQQIIKITGRSPSLNWYDVIFVIIRLEQQLVHGKNNIFLPKLVRWHAVSHDKFT